MLKVSWAEAAAAAQQASSRVRCVLQSFMRFLFGWWGSEIGHAVATPCVRPRKASCVALSASRLFDEPLLAMRPLMST